MRTRSRWAILALITVAAAVRERPAQDYYSPVDTCRYLETKWVGCNHCRCLWTWATWSCTRNVCSPAETRGRLKECYHGEEKLEDCNRCSCQYGLWVCGLDLCGADCRDGAVKHRDCNVCYCIGGKYRCTEYPCIIYNDYSCDPRIRVTIDCNECFCNKSGVGLTCTNLECM